MKAVWRSAAVAIATLAVLSILWEVRRIVLLFVLALGLSAAIRPVVDYLMQQRIPRIWATVATYLLVAALLSTLLVVVSEPSFVSLQRLTDDLAITYERLVTQWAQQGSSVQRAIAQRLPSAEELYASLAGERGAAVAQAVLGIALNLVDIMSQLALVIILSAYWSTQDIQSERVWLSLLPVAARTRVRNTWRELQKSIGEYIRFSAIQSIAAGLGLVILYRSLGLGYAVLLAILAALLRLIPWFGIAAAIILAAAAGLARAPVISLAAALGTLLVFVLLEAITRPWIGPTRRYSSFLIVVVLLPLADIFGITGMILATLVAIIIESPFWQVTEEPTPIVDSATERLSGVKQRLDDLKDRLASTGQEPSPEAAGLIAKLDDLLDAVADMCLQGTAWNSSESRMHCDPPMTLSLPDDRGA